MNPRPPLYSIVFLVLLTLIAGVGLGWLLRDRVMPAPSSAPSRVVAAPSATPTLAPTTIATAVPTLAPALRATPAPTLLPSATPEPLPSATPTAEPSEPIVAYSAYVVAPGDDLASIAANGGSSIELIRSYNRLQGQLVPGRPLIVPRRAGQVSVLPEEQLLVERGHSDKPWVALTLDAGAGAEPLPAILQALRERNIQITFFLTGKWISENPELTREILADGHEIANHSFSHPDFRTLNDAQIAQELAETERLFQETTGSTNTTRPLFRPPYGAYDERVLRQVIAQGYLPIYWTLDSLDSVGEPKTPAFLLERVTGKLSPEQLRGAIILAHCGSAATAAALPAILDRFAAMGLEVHTVSAVLGS